MPTIQQSIKVNASPDVVWQFLGNLAAAPEYVPGIVSATVDGSRRVCLDQDNNTIHEEISDYSDAARTFSFTHIQSPLPVKSSRGSFVVDEQGRHSIVSMTWELEFLDPAMESNLLPMIEGAAQMTLANIKQRTETR